MISKKLRMLYMKTKKTYEMLKYSLFKKKYFNAVSGILELITFFFY